ncbi:hypothetical protein LJR129_000173 [Acidovorax sp. LjRoot129]|uniref:hypothetical protein n=1 Tax=Acidovorax sp. LjRoot129 TaxID=3342260 RepID=UPI003ECE6BB9
MPHKTASQDTPDATGRFGALREGLLLVAAALLLLVAPPAQQPSGTVSDFPRGASIAGPVAASPAQPKLAPSPAPRLAQFGGQEASAEVRQIANWTFHSGDHQQRAVVVVDKKDAKVYVFDAGGRLQGAAPALLGSAIGDHTVPGIGDKPIAQVLPAERTTPAGRFIAEPGVNANGEDVVWVDYDAAVSMHRVRANVKAERRLERLASKTAKDNRISFGCINLPVSFYEKVLSPAVRRTGAVVYVLPETQPAARLFGAYDVPHAARSTPQ